MLFTVVNIYTNMCKNIRATITTPVYALFTLHLGSARETTFKEGFQI